MRLSTLVVFAGLIGCAQPAAVIAVSPAAGRHFGAPFGGASLVGLGDIANTPQRYVSATVRVQGNVVAVCQEMGCWMEIRDQATQAHIRMHGHSFFVPRDASGHRATVEATVVAAHPATECDQEAHQATGRVAQIELDATGIELN